jgi:hypothetical protein
MHLRFAFIRSNCVALPFARDEVERIIDGRKRTNDRHGRLKNAHIVQGAGVIHSGCRLGVRISCCR